LGVKQLSHYGKIQTEGVRQQTAMETVYTLQDDQSHRTLTRLQHEFQDLQPTRLQISWKWSNQKR